MQCTISLFTLLCFLLLTRVKSYMLLHGNTFVVAIGTYCLNQMKVKPPVLCLSSSFRRRNSLKSLPWELWFSFFYCNYNFSISNTVFKMPSEQRRGLAKHAGTGSAWQTRGFNRSEADRLFASPSFHSSSGEKKITFKKKAFGAWSGQCNANVLYSESY